MRLAQLHDKMAAGRDLPKHAPTPSPRSPNNSTDGLLPVVCEIREVREFLFVECCQLILFTYSICNYIPTLKSQHEQVIGITINTMMIMMVYFSAGHHLRAAVARSGRALLKLVTLLTAKIHGHQVDGFPLIRRHSSCRVDVIQLKSCVTICPLHRIILAPQIFVQQLINSEMV